MADPHIITTLHAKRDAIEATILAYQGKVDQARRDLAHVNATLALFASDEPGEVRAYTDTSRLFRRGEMVKLCKAALASHGPQDTREVARRVAEAKGMDAADPVLRKALAYRIVQALTLQWKRGGLGSEGIRTGVRVWRTNKVQPESFQPPVSFSPKWCAFRTTGQERAQSMSGTLYFGDNLDVLREHVKDESVDLIYLDPPFNSAASYNVLFKTTDGKKANRKLPHSRTHGTGLSLPKWHLMR